MFSFLDKLLFTINIMELTEKKCVACEGDVPPIKGTEIQEYLSQLKNPWEVIDETKIQRNFTFKDFIESMKFVNSLAELAEKEGHHPDIHIHYNEVLIVLWTHAIGGLSENDFIVAAKIDAL